MKSMKCLEMPNSAKTVMTTRYSFSFRPKRINHFNKFRCSGCHNYYDLFELTVMANQLICNICMNDLKKHGV